MWHTLTLQRPHRAKQGDKARSQQQQQEDRGRLRRAKTFCDNLADEDVSGQRSKAAAGSRTWLKNIKNWRKKFTKTELNFADDGFSKSCSASKESLDKISCGPGLSEKVSRRAILDRSLHYQPKLDDSHHDQDDIWYSSSKLFEDHVSEIHGKWDAIEDDIWGKVIVMERNRRVAKAYVRSPVVSVG